MQKQNNQFFLVIVGKRIVNKRQVFIRVPTGSKFLKDHTLCRLKLLLSLHYVFINPLNTELNPICR